MWTFGRLYFKLRVRGTRARRRAATKDTESTKIRSQRTGRRLCVLKLCALRALRGFPFFVLFTCVRRWGVRRCWMTRIVGGAFAAVIVCAAALVTVQAQAA